MNTKYWLRCGSAAALLFAVLFLLSVPLGASTIISTDGQGDVGYGLLAGAYALESGWSQTGTYTAVTITAEIVPGSTGSGTSGTADLMTQIGPGTTVADQIATAPFSVTGTFGSPSLETLFTGLTLGPGNYYLVLYSGTDIAGWGITGGTTPVTAPGVSLISHGTTYPDSPAVYPPASSNFPSTTGFTNELEFTVTGLPSTSAVPEPGAGALALLCTGLLGLGGAIKRNFFS